MKNARFWVDHKGSFVKLTIKPGEEINTIEGGLTDEGFDYTNTTYRYEDGLVFCSQVRDAKDCDGPMSWSWKGFFDPCNYKTRGVFVGVDADYEEIWDDSIQLVCWERASSSQRDIYAELMGY